jgi:hypothetical protein
MPATWEADDEVWVGATPQAHNFDLLAAERMMRMSNRHQSGRRLE